MTKAPHAQRLSVNMDGRKVGELGQSSQGPVYFVYDTQWLQNGFPLTKRHLQFDPKPQTVSNPEFWGLFGVFNDSLPDGWGLLLMDRALKEKKGWAPSMITGLDRLAYIGNRGMGALEYVPMIPQGHLDAAVDLSELAKEADLVFEGNDGSVLENLLLHGGSGGGARPKVTVARDPVEGLCVSGFQPLRPGFEHWIVKFRHGREPLDTGRAEKAYAHFAQEAGLIVADTDLIEVTVKGKSEAYFASKRFDREGDKKIHMLSLAGLLHASHRAPTVDYDSILGATRMLTGSVDETSKMFRQMVFNVVSANRDDHSKNFSFLFQKGGWIASPSYDLSMSPNADLRFQHMAAINGSGSPSRRDILAVAETFDVPDAKLIVDQVVDVASRWNEFASLYDVGEDLTDEIGSEIKAMIKKVKAPGPQGKSERK